MISTTLPLADPLAAMLGLGVSAPAPVTGEDGVADFSALVAGMIPQLAGDATPPAGPTLSLPAVRQKPAAGLPDADGDADVEATVADDAASETDMDADADPTLLNWFDRPVTLERTPALPRSTVEPSADPIRGGGTLPDRKLAAPSPLLAPVPPIPAGNAVVGATPVTEAPAVPPLPTRPATGTIGWRRAEAIRVEDVSQDPAVAAPDLAARIAPPRAPLPEPLGSTPLAPLIEHPGGVAPPTVRPAARETMEQRIARLLAGTASPPRPVPVDGPAAAPLPVAPAATVVIPAVAPQEPAPTAPIAPTAAPLTPHPTTDAAPPVVVAVADPVPDVPAAPATVAAAPPPSSLPPIAAGADVPTAAPATVRSVEPPVVPQPVIGATRPADEPVSVPAAAGRELSSAIPFPAAVSIVTPPATRDMPSPAPLSSPAPALETPNADAAPPAPADAAPRPATADAARPTAPVVEQTTAPPLPPTPGVVPAAAPAPAVPVVAVAAGMTLPTLDTTRADWIDALVERIEVVRAADGIRHAQMRLAPDALGAIDVRVEQGPRGEIAVHVEAQTAHGRAAMAEAAPRLAEMVEARGLKLADAGVTSGSGQGERRSPQPESRQPDRPAPARAESSDPEASAAADRLA